MSRYSNEEMADMVLIYGEARGNSRLAVRIYRERFGNTRNVPNPRTFSSLYRRLRENGRFVVASQHSRVNPNVDVEQQILDYFEENPTASTRSAATAIGVGHVRVWRTLNSHELHPHRYMRVQGMLPSDFEPRIQFCSWLLQNIRRRPSFTAHILFTDEAKFTREGVFNHQNMHEWSYSNPHNVSQHSHQVRFSVNVWAGIIGNHLIGPHILPDNLTGAVYTEFLENTLPYLLQNVPEELRNTMWFQHDGAPAHFATSARAILNARYPNRWIGRNGSVAWPPRSPDLTPMDFYFWGHIKSLIYRTPVESLEDLVARISVAAGEISDNGNIVFHNVRCSLQNRVQLCIQENGRHFEHLL